MAERPYGRLEWFESLYDRQEPGKAAVSPDEAQAMVDRAIASLGVDPQEAIDEDGWRHLGLGTAHAMVNVLEWDPGEYYLAVWSPILRAPRDTRLRAALFESLLRLNHHSVGEARISLLEGDLVVISVVHPIAGLEVGQILDAIRTVLEAADRLDEPLQESYKVAMPGIEMDKATWETIRDVLRLCDPYAQRMFSYLMEGWVARKGRVTTGRHTIGLDSANSGKTLSALIGGASAGPIVTVGWSSLARQGLRSQDEAAFKGAIPRPQGFEITASSAHLAVDESFTEAMADQFLDALVMLDKALKKAVPPEKLSLPDLEQRWGLKIDVGGATQRGIDALLGDCSPEVRKVYTLLIQGWHDAGQKLYTKTENSVALRLSVYSHTFALCSLWAPSKNKPAYIWLYYPLFHDYFRGLDEARRRYEQGVARMPGFTPQNSGASITVDQNFTEKSVQHLLKILTRLGEDVKPTFAT